MTVKKLMELIAKQKEIQEKSNINPIITKLEKSAPIYHFVVKEEHNNFGENHMNNVYWGAIDDNNQERFSIWYTQFCGPFYSEGKFIDGTINLLNGEIMPIGSLTSSEVKNFLEGRRFRLEYRNIGCRFRNTHNLKVISEKNKMMDLLRILSQEEREKYLDHGGECIDFFEV